MAVPARAPHCLLCVLSSGGGGGSGGRGGEQGAIPAPVAPALWRPPPPQQLRCPGRFGQGQRAAFLTFGGHSVPAPSEGRAWAVWGTRHRGLWVGWRAKGSGQVLEDVGGRGWGRGCAGAGGGCGQIWGRRKGEGSGPVEAEGLRAGSGDPWGPGRARKGWRAVGRVGGSPWGFGRV